MTMVELILICATLQFVTAGWCFALSWAPGWGHFRVLALAATAAGLYALVDTVYITATFSDATVSAAGRVSVWLGLIAMGALLWQHRLSRGEPFRKFERVVLWFMVVLALGSVLSPWGWSELVTLGVSDGIPWRSPGQGFWPQVSILVVVVLYGSMLVDHIRGFAETRGLQSTGRLVGSGLFFLALLGEGSANLGGIEFPAFVDLGFSALMLSAAFEIVLRVIRDASTLRELNEVLEAKVEERSALLVEARHSLLLAERQAAVGQLAASVGHEINNPLTYMLVNLECVRANLEARGNEFEEDVELLVETLSGARRIARIARDLTILKRSTPMGDIESNLDEVLREVLEKTRGGRVWRGELPVHLEHTRTVSCDASRLEQILLSVVENALFAHSERVTVRAKDHEKGVLIEVLDDGEGIKPEVLPHIFDPLFTTREVGEGMGLGLFVAKGFVELSGGRIEIQSTVGEGSHVSIWLPAAA